MTSPWGIENPAFRLQEYLTALKSMTNNIRRDQAMAEMLGVSRDHPDVNMGIARLLMLPDRVIEVLPADEAQADADLYLAWETNARAAVRCFTEPHEVLDGVQRAYDEGTLMSLRAAAGLIRASHRHAVAPPADLVQIRTDFEAIETQVRGAPDIDPKLRRFLLDIVQETIRAIDLYPITGEDGVRQATEQWIGAMCVRYPGVNPSHGQSAETRSTWDRIFAGMKALLVIVSVGDTSLQLVDGAVKMIEGG